MLPTAASTIASLILVFFFFFFSGSDYKAFNGKKLDDIKDKVFSKPHDVPTENHRIRGTGEFFFFFGCFFVVVVENIR